MADTHPADVADVLAGTRPPNAYEEDLKARWRPSEAQIAAADAKLTEQADQERPHVWTIHLLLNKQPGWWTLDVQVVPIEGPVYLTRNDAWEAAEFAARVAAATVAAVLPDGAHVSAGWTVHSPNGWAVFEA